MSAQPGKSYFWLKIAVVVLVLLAAGAVAYVRSRPTAIVTTVRRDKAADVVAGSVVVHADKDLQDIKSEMPGRVIWIDTRQLGELFRKDEPIVKLDSSDAERMMKEAADTYNAQVKRSEIQRTTDPRKANADEALQNAERAYKRNELSESQWKQAQRAHAQVLTELDLADYDLQQAKTKFENDQAAAKRQIEKMTIRAPMDCVLRDMMVALGALIGPNTTVATYFSTQRVVIAKVGEEDIGRVKLGDPAQVRLLNIGQTFDATVTTILPFADPDTRYTVYLDVKTELKNLVPFSTGEAAITVGHHDNALVIPRRALFNDDLVFVVKGGVIEKRKLQIGYRALNYAEVTGGLKDGEQVIADDVDQFRDGQRVRTELAK